MSCREKGGGREDTNKKLSWESEVWVCMSKVMMEKQRQERYSYKTRPLWQHRGVKRVSERVKDKEKEQPSRKMDWGHEMQAQGSQIKYYLSKERSVVTLQTHFKQEENWSKSKGASTYWKVKGFAKNMKESTIVMAFLPVVTAKEQNIHVECKFMYLITNMKQKLNRCDFITRFRQTIKLSSAWVKWLKCEIITALVHLDLII